MKRVRTEALVNRGRLAFPSAHSFPIAMLSRTMNPYTKEVLEYVSFWKYSPACLFLVFLSMLARISVCRLNSVKKNALGKIIIVYDEDERIASLAATTMCERGFENLFMLCGGESWEPNIVSESLLTSSQLI